MYLFFYVYLICWPLLVLCSPLLNSGTTLDLLRFPLLKATPQRLLRRRQRLDQEAKQTEEQLSQEELRRLQVLSRQGYLLGE